MKSPATGNWELEDARDEIFDLAKVAKNISDALDCAETCETDTDLSANLDDALSQAMLLVEQLKSLKGVA